MTSFKNLLIGGSNSLGVQPLPYPSTLAPLKWLEGTWRCEDHGQGEFPTIKPFRYSEELNFECVGQTMLNYRSFSWHPEKKFAMHQESGFLRIRPGTNMVSFILAHNFGLTTIEEGSIDGESVMLTSKDISRWSFGNDKKVMKVVREFTLEGDTLMQIMSMETNNTPLTKHLEATYTKVA